MTSPGSPSLQGHGRSVADAAVVACPPAWRMAAALLRTVAGATLLATAWLMVSSEYPPTNPFRQMRIFFALVAGPELAAWCIGRAFAAKMRVESGSLVLDQGDSRVEIPIGAVAAVEPWFVPLPRAGVWLRLRSGRRFARGLQVADADALVRALVAEGADPRIGDGLRGRVASYAGAFATRRRSRFDHPVFKFLVFGLVPTVPAFRLHQIITFGGFLGEYYTFGLKAWLLGFGLWWVSWAFSLLLVAAVLRMLGEPLAMLVAAVAPSRAAAGRLWVERLLRLAYFAGIPGFLLLRLWPW